MNTAVLMEMEVDLEVDAIEEIRLRTWARQNYIPAPERDGDLHPVVLDAAAVMQNTDRCHRQPREQQHVD